MTPEQRKRYAAALARGQNGSMMCSELTDMVELVEELDRERDDLAATIAGLSKWNADHQDRIAELERERDAAERALERWQTDSLIESDYIRPNGTVIDDPYRRAENVGDWCDRLWSIIAAHDRNWRKIADALGIKHMAGVDVDDNAQRVIDACAKKQAR